MDMTEYLENMGITICQRAFFSYMAKPQGSYGLHMIFRLFLKKKRIIMLERDRAGWCRFLADYAVLRLYPAVHIIFYLQEAVDAILRNDLMKKPPRLLLDNQIRIQKPAAQNLSQDHPNRTFPRSGHTDQNDIIFRTHKHQPR